MKALKYIFFLLLIAFIGLAIYVAVQPNEYAFNRTRTIKAPISLLYDQVNDFKNWPNFSPWIEQDLDAKIIYNEVTSGIGAKYNWEGEILGIGSMETLKTETNTSIKQKIEFVKPFEANSNIKWDFENTPEGTKVTWAMEGKQDFMTKLATTFMGSIESETGPNFERGLFKLDSITQADMRRYSVNIEGETQHSGGFYLYNTTSCKLSSFKEKMQEMLPKIAGYALTHNITMAGKPFIIYHKWDEENDAVIFSCAIPTNSKIVTNESDVLTGQLESFKAIKTVLNGDYENLKEAWDKTMAYVTENNLELIENGPMIEIYITEPSTTVNPADWITEIFIAIK